MTRRRLLVAGLGAVIGALAVGAAVSYEPGDGALVRAGDPRPARSFEVPDLRDPAATIALRDFAGRPVILNFWASWCVPCRREMPAFQAVHQRLGDRVAFVGLNHQDNREAALDLLDKTGVTYPSGFDPRGKVATAYDLIGMPTTVLITADGRVFGKRTGEMKRDELEAAIRDLLGGKERRATTHR